jgi:hypothetical protein
MGGEVSDVASLAAESRGNGRGSKITVLNFKKLIFLLNIFYSTEQKERKFNT